MSGPPLALCPVVVHGPFSSHGKELVADLLNSVQVCGTDLYYLNVCIFYFYHVHFPPIPQPDCPKAVVCCASEWFYNCWMVTTLYVAREELFFYHSLFN